MVSVIDVLYLLFIFITLYFTFLFMTLFVKNKPNLATKLTYALSALPTVSIIVPAHNEARNITSTLRNLKRLKYPKDKLEILVVDDGSTDDTARLARRAGVKVISQENRGKAAALNRGIKAARGEIVACVDADSYPKADSLMKAVQSFKDKRVAAVTTRIFVLRPKNFLGRLQNIEYALIAWLRKLFEFIDSVYVTPGPLSLYRKSVLRKVGGFDEKNMTEDIEVAWHLLRDGYEVKMSDAQVYTRAPHKFRLWLRQRVRWNIGGIQTTKKYFRSFLRPSAGAFGLFVLPYFSMSYVLAVLAISIYIYLFLAWFVNSAIFSFHAAAIGLNPAKYWNLYFLPDIFTVFGISGLVISLVFVRVGLHAVNKQVSGFKSWIDLLTYLAFYISAFPFILIYSVYRMARKNFSW